MNTRYLNQYNLFFKPHIKNDKKKKKKKKKRKEEKEKEKEKEKKNRGQKGIRTHNTSPGC